MGQATAAAHDSNDLGDREGARVAALVSSDPELEFFVTDVVCGDDMAAVERASSTFAVTMPETGVVMLSAGPRRLIVHARVPAPRATLSGCAYRLLAEALVDVPHVTEDGATDLCATAVVWKDESTSRDPWADKDTARTAVAEYMQEAGLFGDESDEERAEEYEITRGADYDQLIARVRSGEGSDAAVPGADS